MVHIYSALEQKELADLSQTAAGSRTEKTDVIRNLHQRHRHSVESTVELHHSVVSSQGFKLVGSRDERQARGCGNLVSDLLGKALGCVETSPNRSATLCVGHVVRYS